jgi:hypothetical protein
MSSWEDFSAILSEDTSLTGIISVDDSASVSGSLSQKTITVQAPYDMTFWYTLDGTTPTISSWLYTNPITISAMISGDCKVARFLAQSVKTLETLELSSISACVIIPPVIPTPPPSGITSIASLVLEYDISDAYDSNTMWTDLARTTLAGADDEVETFDASFVTSAAVTTPRANSLSTLPLGKSILKLSPDSAVPPAGLPILQLFFGAIGQGGLETDWHDHAPLDTLMTGEDTPWSLAFVLNPTRSAGIAGTIFTWISANSEYNTIELLSDGKLRFTRVASGGSVVVDSTSAVDGGWKTYVVVFTGTSIAMYEDDTALLADTVADTDGTQTGNLRSRIGLFNFSGQLNADLAALSLYDEAVTSEQVTTITNFYNDRFGI